MFNETPIALPIIDKVRKLNLGVAITEVRDTSSEDSGQGGGVRRLALNRYLSWESQSTFNPYFDKFVFLIRCGPILLFLLLLRPSLPGAEESNDAGRDGEKPTTVFPLTQIVTQMYVNPTPQVGNPPLSLDRLSGWVPPGI